MVQLGSDDQAKVLNLARALAKSPKCGTSGRDFERVVGTIPHDDLEQMKRIIEEECDNS